MDEEEIFLNPRPRIEITTAMENQQQRQHHLELERQQIMLMHQQKLEEDLQKISVVASKKVKARTVTQILAVVAVSFGAYIAGTTVTFPAVAIPSLLEFNRTSSLPFVMHKSDVALIVSIASFGMLLGSLVAGPLVSFIGRKWTTIVGTCGSLTLSYTLIAVAEDVWMILLGRFFAGSGMGFSMTVSTLYIIEIATPKLRGRLAVVPAITGTLGVLTCQCLGAFLDWVNLSIVLALMNLPFLIMILFIPETPVYLIATDQIERAHKILRWLRGRNWDVTKELTDLKVASEMPGLGNHPKTKMRDLLSSPEVLKPLTISLFLMFFFQCSGINIVLQYTVDIFQMAESSVNKFQATILLGIALLISNIFTLCVVSKMKRRLMILLSSLGISVALMIMGVYFLLKDLEKAECSFSSSSIIPVAEKLSNSSSSPTTILTTTTTTTVICPPTYTKDIAWLPLLVLMFYIFFFNLGYGALIWITVAEILPLKVRSLSNSLSVGFTCIMSFLTSHSYTALKEQIAIKGVFWLYAVLSFIGFIFIFLFVPETKNRTEAEILAYFQSKKREKKKKERGEEGEEQEIEEGTPLKEI